MPDGISISNSCSTRSPSDLLLPLLLCLFRLLKLPATLFDSSLQMRIVGVDSNPISSEYSDSDLSSRTSSSSSCCSYSSSSSFFLLNYFVIALLLSFSNPLIIVQAVESVNILMPSELDLDSPSLEPTCPSLNPALNYRPVIGILSHPGDGASGRLSNVTSASYIAASYVKFVESAGARVIPLIYNEPPEILFEKLKLVNGVIFTGGWAKSGLYYSVAEKILKQILKRNDAGDRFPLYAICLGFELISMMISKDKNILESTDAWNMASSLQFVDNVNIEGTVFQRFPSDLLTRLSTDCLVMQRHRYGISPQRFQENQYLSSFFRVLTTSVDRDNKAYVSTAHANNYPVTAFQWHPEKNAFEWGLPMIPHSEHAVQVTQHVANYLVSEARKSLNRPSTEKILDNLIYNYKPTYCGKAGRGFDEVYIFTLPSSL